MDREKVQHATDVPVKERVFLIAIRREDAPRTGGPYATT